MCLGLHMYIHASLEYSGVIFYHTTMKFAYYVCTCVCLDGGNRKKCQPSPGCWWSWRLVRTWFPFGATPGRSLSQPKIGKLSIQSAVNVMIATFRRFLPIFGEKMACLCFSWNRTSQFLLPPWSDLCQSRQFVSNFGPRLGEFSPIGLFVIACICLKITEVALIF
jgi:hypothetical protein